MKIVYAKNKGVKCVSAVIKITVAVIFSLMLIKYPSLTAQGAREGLCVCAESVIPTLFPMTVLCTFLAVSGISEALGRFMHPFMKKVFKLPGSASSAVIMGMVGGYPTGIKMTGQLYRENSISQNDANRMCLFCLSAGPAFLIGTVGTVMMSDVRIGRVLFLSSCLSTLTVGFLLRFTANEEDIPTKLPSFRPITSSLCEAVTTAGGAMLSVSAWIILFSCICKTLTELPDGIRLPLCSVLEVTNGTKAAIEAGISIPVISAILSFAGLSVHCQVWSCIEECDVKASHFIVSRIVSGALSALYCKAILHFFPIEQSTLMAREGLFVHSFSVSAPVSAAMLLTAGVFIINTSGKTNDFIT
ncbi:MAG: hypothetical protein IJB86_07715 [Clostridia bacterium]|nr:hypothetical protein [Clostridia bacterium]